jgi:hypothetical protein
VSYEMDGELVKVTPEFLRTCVEHVLTHRRQQCEEERVCRCASR